MTWKSERLAPINRAIPSPSRQPAPWGACPRPSRMIAVVIILLLLVIVVSLDSDNDGGGGSQ